MYMCVIRCTVCMYAYVYDEVWQILIVLCYLIQLLQGV